MTSEFSQHISAAQKAERIIFDETHLEHPGGSKLSVRKQGCFITELTLFNQVTDTPTQILYAAPDHGVNKLNASHIMSPVGPSDGIGGQHGFARWAQYHEFPQPNDGGPLEQKFVAMQAKRPDLGIGISKEFGLYDDSFSMQTSLVNSEKDSVHTSLGEHLYFALQDEDERGVKIDGKTLDELLGEGSEDKIMNGEAIFWPDYTGSANIKFPAGHFIGLDARVSDNAKVAPMGMLIWHREGSPSICFEPTVGFDPEVGSNLLEVNGHDTASLFTTICLNYGPEPEVSKKVSLNEADTFERDGFTGHIYKSGDDEHGFSALQVDVHGSHPKKRMLPGTTRSYYVAEGVGTFTLNGKTHTVEQGDFYTITSGDEYEYEGQMRLFEFNVSPDNEFRDEKL